MSSPDTGHRQNLTAQLLELLNLSHEEEGVIRDVLLLIKAHSGIEAVGIRINDGHDYPYFETNGLPQVFVRAENFLCAKAADGDLLLDADGLPILECMCGNIIRGRFDASLPFFTDAGSFWTNCTTQLLASTTEVERQARTRNRCNQVGYESVALIPLKTPRGNIGLLQLNDHRRDMFSPAMIAFYEHIAANIGIAIRRKRADEALTLSSRQWQSTFDAMADGVFLMDAQQRVLNCNQSMAKLLGKQAGAIIGQPCWKAMHGRTAPVEGCPHLRMLNSGQQERLVLSAENHVLDLTVDPVFDDDDHIVGSVHVVSDVTARIVAEEALRETEEKFRHAQKMEAVGRLAGGVAHDFNNMLSAIIGYSDLILMNLGEGDSLIKDVTQIRQCADRAAALTNQLLAFSRKQALQPRTLDLNAVVGELQAMLPRLIGEDIEAQMALESDLGCVVADPGQIQQVLMNLAINARDAMPEGGKLLIETANVEIGPEHDGHLGGLRHGPHVMLAITDTGSGMDEETQTQIFEPFFTTKELGKGTGLGLSTVYGIVRQSGGDIEVQSAPGQGTTFKIYLPLVDIEARPLEPRPAVRSSQRGGRTVLVVEDEEKVRELICRILRVGGYRVLEAPHGEAALTLAAQNRAPIDLLITDVVMPTMSGRDLADRITAGRPELRVLYTSGYTDNIIAHRGVLDPGMHYIHKPFTVDTLLSKVHEVLDGL